MHGLHSLSYFFKGHIPNQKPIGHWLFSFLLTSPNAYLIINEIYCNSFCPFMSSSSKLMVYPIKRIMVLKSITLLSLGFLNTCGLCLELPALAPLPQWVVFGAPNPCDNIQDVSEGPSSYCQKSIFNCDQISQSLTWGLRLPYCPYRARTDIGHSSLFLSEKSKFKPSSNCYQPNLLHRIDCFQLRDFYFILFYFSPPEGIRLKLLPKDQADYSCTEMGTAHWAGGSIFSSCTLCTKIHNQHRAHRLY